MTTNRTGAFRRAMDDQLARGEDALNAEALEVLLGDSGVPVVADIDLTGSQPAATVREPDTTETPAPDPTTW